MAIAADEIKFASILKRCGQVYDVEDLSMIPKGFDERTRSPCIILVVVLG
jgi:hypothetical protein